MLGVYLSGTGNTKHCVEKFVSLLDENAEIIPLEGAELRDQIREKRRIVLGYPTQFSNAPIMVRDFIKNNKYLWVGKEIFVINTMGAFSGDGTGCSARMLKKYGAMILGGLQIKMPDSVCDSKLLKKSYEQNRDIIKAADCKIEKWVIQINNGIYPQEGLKLIDHAKGLFGQRLWYYRKTATYSSGIKINDNCIGCGLCVQKCPMNNLTLEQNGGKPLQSGKCTMCYSCISQCPKQAITLLGKNVIEQTRYEKFL